MLGIQLEEIFSLAKQIGLAVAGASALWALVFSYRAKRVQDTHQRLIIENLVERLAIPHSLAVILALTGWTALTILHMPRILAHEGIALAPTYDAIAKALTFFSPLYIALALLTLYGLVSYLRSQQKFMANIHKYLWAQFIIIAILISFPALTGSFDNEQFFIIGHSAHSIFTVGTVLVLDFLFFLTKHLKETQKHFYPLFPVISKVIWLGLALDFLSVALVFEGALQLTPKFFFMQTIIGILIINGAFLSGPITKKMLAGPLSRKWLTVATFSGVISITSWLSVTTLDAFAGLTLGYAQLAIIYAGIIATGFIGYLLFDAFSKKENPLL